MIKGGLRKRIIAGFAAGWAEMMDCHWATVAGDSGRAESEAEQSGFLMLHACVSPNSEPWWV